MKFGFVYKDQLLKKIQVGVGQDLKIGRSSVCQIVLPVEVISSSHAQLATDQHGNCFLTDLHSTNGTYINGQRLVSGTPSLIKAGDHILLSLSGVQLVFDPVDSSYSGIVFDSVKSDVHTKPVKSLSEALKTKELVYIGRSEDSDIVLDSLIVSRKHAVVEKKKNGTFLIRDLDSSNGTFVNGKRISTPTPLSENDIILIGRFKLSLQGVATNLSTEIAIQVKSIAKKFDNGKFGLHTATFDIRSNSLLAIMGPSGCGKSTLLKALNGASPVTHGSVHICGLELYSNYEYLKTQIGYVPQDDIVHRELTVEQSLRFAARLRMQNKSEAEIEERIKKVLEDLNITKIRKSKVGDISGGQRKRVSIAVEILNEPMILFLDEPTSPLDPQTIEDFLTRLQNLSRQGMTVILVTHKPEDLNYVNEVMFLAEGGHVTFFGKVNQYLKYFEADDTVKVYSSLTAERSQKWINKYKQQNAQNTTGEKLTTKKLKKSNKTEYFSQFWWLTMRYFTIKLNDRKNMVLMLLQAIIIPALICTIYEHLEISILFLMSVSAIWFGTNNAAREIVGELPIYKRERMYNLGIFPYIFSKITVLGVFSAVQSLIFVLIVSLFYRENDQELATWASFPKAYIWMFILSIVSTLYGLLFSAITENTEKVMTIVPIALLPQIMLAGVLARITNWKVEVLSYLTISRWGTNGFSVIQQTVSRGIPEKVDGKRVDKFIDENAVTSLKENFHDNLYDKFLNLFGEYSNSIWPNFVSLGFLSLLFLTIIIFALKAKDSIKN
jgi:ABC-type multidrug transport system ATPase subunit/pSer/pThr/pTyr-binding forkhead associated (FHA) protein